MFHVKQASGRPAGGRAGAQGGRLVARAFPGAGVRAIGKEGPLGAVRGQRDLRVVSQFDEGPLIAMSGPSGVSTREPCIR